jgi:hypothetical protein
MTTIGFKGTVCDLRQYNQSVPSRDNPNPSISCLTHGQSIGLAVSIWFICPRLELIPCAADSRSIAPQLHKCHRHIYMDGRMSTSFHVSFLFDEMLHSGTYDGIERGSQGVTGSCSTGLVTSTWSAQPFSGCPSPGSLNLRDSSPFSCSISYKLWVVSSISSGLTTGS